MADLKLLLTEYGCPSPLSAKEFTIADCRLSILQLRDRLFPLGTILYEDLEDQVYVVAVRSGFQNMSGAVLAMQLQNSSLIIAGYAKEGIVKQNLLESAVKHVEDAIQGKRPPSRPKWFPLLLSVFAVIGILSVLFAIKAPPDIKQTISPPEVLDEAEAQFNREVEQTIAATVAYNEAIEQFNRSVADYNQAVSLACIDNISGFPAVLEPLSLESESFEDNAAAVNGGNSKEKIGADTNTVKEMTAQVESATAIISQITAPTGEWVQSRLATVSAITMSQAVTAANDPTGLLGRPGGFSSCVYFSVASINPKDTPGHSIVAKGTDAGGAVEVYSSLAEAEARCAYLAGFDGSVLYSGSYALVGTMVIRTSYKLTNEQQLHLTNAITNSLTTLQ